MSTENPKETDKIEQKDPTDLKQDPKDIPIVNKIGEFGNVIGNVTEWDTTSLVEHATVIITARRRSGKSFALQRIMADNFKRYDECYIFSKTINLVPKSEYSFIPAENKFDHLDEQKIRDILNKQGAILSFNQDRSKKEQIRSNVCIILDDIITDANFRKQNNIVSELFVQGRHSMITIFVLVQTFGGREGIPPVLRKNADLIITFFQHSFDDRESMCRQFLSLVDRKIGMEYLRQVTNEEHTACVIDVNNTSARVYEDYIFRYKAPSRKIPKFMIGSNEKRLKETIVVDKSAHTKDQRIKTSKAKNTTRVRNKKIGFKPAFRKVSKKVQFNNKIKIRTFDNTDFTRTSINILDENYAL